VTFLSFALNFSIPSYLFFCSLVSVPGDEIDFQYKQEMDEIIGLTESPETAFTLFYDVVKNLFEWDQQGGGGAGRAGFREGVWFGCNTTGCGLD